MTVGPYNLRKGLGERRGRSSGGESEREMGKGRNKERYLSI